MIPSTTESPESLALVSPPHMDEAIGHIVIGSKQSNNGRLKDTAETMGRMMIAFIAAVVFGGVAAIFGYPWGWLVMAMGLIGCVYYVVMRGRDLQHRQDVADADDTKPNW